MSPTNFAPAPLHFDRHRLDISDPNRCVDWSDYPVLFERPSEEPKRTTVFADHGATPVSRSGRDIREAFLGYCQAMLLRPESVRFDRPSERSAATAAIAAATSHGFSREEIRRLGCGLYPSPAAVREHLRGVGFSDREIETAALTCDASGRQRVELSGNLVVPLADEHGQTRDFFLVAIDERLTTFASYRFLYGSCSSGMIAYGLDAALAPARAHNALVLVEDILDAFLLQSHGLHNVAAVGGRGRDFAPRRWEELARMGIETVVLAFRQDERHARNIRDALVNALRARTAPEVFVASTYPTHEQSPLDVLRRFGRESCARALNDRTLAFHQKDFGRADRLSTLAEIEDPTARLELEPYYRSAYRQHLDDLVSALPTEYRSIHADRLAAVDGAIRGADWPRLRHLVGGTERRGAAAPGNGKNSGKYMSDWYFHLQGGPPLADERFRDIPASEAEIQSLLAEWEMREIEATRPV